jgi:hypothetical protein
MAQNEKDMDKKGGKSGMQKPGGAKSGGSQSGTRGSGSGSQSGQKSQSR